MLKTIKNSISISIIILSITIGYVAYAEDTTTNIRIREGDAPERSEARNEIKNQIETNKLENQANREEFQNKLEEARGELDLKREEQRTQLREMVEATKEKREAFKVEMQTKREEIKLKVEEMKASFKENIQRIKDDGKKISAEKIVDTIHALNERITGQLSDKVAQIENVLVSIESRITKAESNNLDTSLVKAEVVKDKDAIKTARDAISLQAEKVYDVTITDEATLRSEMQKMRDAFNTDIKAVREQVKAAHVAVSLTATTLAKIPKIDDIDNDNDEDEDNEEDTEENDEVEEDESTTNN